MRFLAALALAAALVGAPAARAGEPAPVAEVRTVPELVTALKGTYKDVQGLSAEFTQVQRSGVTGEIRQKGKVAIQRPKKARWEFVGGGPTDSLFVTNGKTMWVYTPSMKQVIETPDVGAGNGMAQLLDGFDKLDEMFEVKLLDTAGGAQKKSYVVELVPRKPAQFKKVRVEFEKKRLLLERVTIEDPFGTTTEITFSGLKTNPTLAAGTFDFQPPAGVQVIKQGTPTP